MKNYLKLLILAFTASTVLVSCEEYLDVSPEMGITGDQVFTDYYLTRGVVDRANRLVHNYVFFQSDWDSEVGQLADECQTSAVRFPTYNTMNSGNWMNTNIREFRQISNLGNREFHGNQWPVSPSDQSLVGIRTASTVIENIEMLTEYPAQTGYTAEQLKNQLLGQAHFIRAWHYFQIVRRYGPMPNMNLVFTPDADFDIERPSYQESTDYMVEDLDLAISLLPDSWDVRNKGRVTKTSARALKAMTLLYAASPLMNPQINGDVSSSSRDYNMEYAKAAAAAAAEGIASYQSAGYELYDWDNYRENWLSRESPISQEALLQPPPAQTGTGNNGTGGQGWFLPQYMGGWAAGGQPTQNAVDWFETSDGWDIDDAPSASFDSQDPYENRDPRLRRLINVQGDDLFEGFTSTGGTPRYMESQVGGWHYNKEVNAGKFFCGYYHKGKHRWPGCDQWNRSTGWFRIFPHIRVAQLYLDFAEAANEAYGPTGTVPGTTLTAVSALNVIRDRVGMPPVRQEYIDAGKAKMRERIYNERAVELYHEFHRWFDLRRWKLAKDVFAEGIYALDLRDQGGNMVYGKKKLDNAIRVFDDKHYWYPFPTSVMNMMSVFEQNPGW